MTKWTEGFLDGALFALAVIAMNDGGGSTLYREVAFNFGLDDLIRAARRSKDAQLEHLSRIAAESASELVRSPLPAVRNVFDKRNIK